MSDPKFLTIHALRIKGFAKTEVVAEIARHDVRVVEQHLLELQQEGHVQFREARALWQLTAEGRTAHAHALAGDVSALDLDTFSAAYQSFLGLNEQFKHLCGEWQLRDGQTNDHTDAGYDAGVIARLVQLNEQAQPIVARLGDTFPRFAGYAPRLAETCQRVVDGETKMLTGVMCGSYHDVWMELHEDLILTQGIDRAKEGSF